MDDLRVEWIRDRVYLAFRIADPEYFLDLMNRNDCEAEDDILHFLNQSSEEEGAAAVFFYRLGAEAPGSTSSPVLAPKSCTLLGGDTASVPRRVRQ